MSSISGITSGSTDATQSSDKSSQALNTDEFMQIMITELTNQDPFEPMKNQELMSQMATLQQLQSNDNMTKSFDNLMDGFDGLLRQDSMSGATRMIGQLISGTDLNGQFAVGRVTSVDMSGDEIALQLDNGQTIKWNDIDRLGGSSSQDIVGDVAIGRAESGENVIGIIDSVELNDQQVVLHVKVSGKEDLVQLPLSNASIINSDNADRLIGYSAEAGDVSGMIESVQWDNDKVMVNILDSDKQSHRVGLEELTSISSPSAT